MKCLRSILIVVAPLLAAAAPAQDASLEQRLDDERFLRGLADRQLGDLLEHYIQMSPDDAVDAARHEIARQRLVLAAPGATAAARLAAVEAMLEVRGRVIDARPGDLRAGSWLLEQASDLYFGLFALDGAELIILLGTPDDLHERRAGRVARQLVELTDRARSAIDRGILALEDDPAFRDDYALQQLHRRLVEEERDRRLPFLAGIGAYLDATVLHAAGTDRRAQLQRAAELLEPLGERLHGGLAGRAMLYAGLARQHLGEPGRATELLEQVAPVAQGNRHLAFTANLARTMAAPIDEDARLRRLEVLDQAQRTPSDLAYRLVVADCLYRVETDASGAAAAVDRYLALLDDRRGVDDRTMRLLVMNRLALSVAPTTDVQLLPPLVTFARAARLGRSDADRPKAIALYEQALQREDADSRSRSVGLLELARLLHEEGRHADALVRFTELAESSPTDPFAKRAMRIAAGLAESLYARTPDDPEIVERAASALDVLLERYPDLPEIDRWQELAGRIALAGRRFDDARRHFESISPDAPRWADGLFMIISAYRMETRSQGTARFEAADDLIATAIRVLPRLAELHDRTADDARAEKLARYRAEVRVAVAQAHLVLNRPDDAVDALAPIELERRLGGRLIATILRTRIEAYRAAGRAGEALTEVARFLDAAPDQVDRVVIPLFDTLLQDIEQLESISRPDDARQRARNDLLPLAELLDPWIAGKDDATSDGLRHLIADAYRHAGRFTDALRHYNTLIGRHPDVLPFILGRAECLYGLGEAHYADAMEPYKRIAAMGAESGGSAYWLAQLRMLQILDRVGRNTNRIVPRIERLRQHDHTLGGERFRRAFDELVRKHR